MQYDDGDGGDKDEPCQSWLSLLTWRAGRSPEWLKWRLLSVCLPGLVWFTSASASAWAQQQRRRRRPEWNSISCKLSSSSSSSSPAHCHSCHLSALTLACTVIPPKRPGDINAGQPSQSSGQATTATTCVTSPNRLDGNNVSLSGLLALLV